MIRDDFQRLTEPEEVFGSILRANGALSPRSENRDYFGQNRSVQSYLWSGTF